jgi:hypothetical protein
MVIRIRKPAKKAAPEGGYRKGIAIGITGKSL